VTGKKTRNQASIIAIVTVAVFIVVTFFAVCISLPFAYFVFKLPLSSKPENWSSFGSYLGGTLGPALSTISLAGVWLTLLFEAKKGEQKDKQKRILVFDLLRNEIEGRYRNIIAADIEKLITLPSDEASAQQFAKGEFNADDLFICSQIASCFSEYYFLEDPKLITLATQINNLMKDLKDFHKLTVRMAGNGSFPPEFRNRLRELKKTLDTAADKIAQEVATG